MNPPDSLQASGKKELKPKHLGKAAFSVSSRVALQLGRESISSSITAIVELVKNAYDADAETVSIRFTNLETPEALMVIQDNGDGMTKEDLSDRWMVIGTDHKLEKRTTGKKRSVTGEKGLGRLGLDRLCAQTIVESCKGGSNEGVRLEVNWKLYEENNKRLETVEHDLYSIQDLGIDPISGNKAPFPKGTRLILRGLKDSWKREGLIELRRDLGLLVSPFSGPKDFSINIEGTNYEEIDGKVEVPQSLLEKCDWQVTASLDVQGLMDISMKSPRHDAEFNLKPTPWVEAIKKMGDTPLCGPLRMEFYFFIRRDSELAGQRLKASEITAFIKNNQGIRIYRDGFRVKPYGEPDGSGDWLKLAYRRMQNPEAITQQGWRVGHNQVVGAIFIKRSENPGLNDQTNREGLLVGEAFAHLRAFSERVIRFFETKAYLVRSEQKTETEKADQKTKSSLSGTESAINKLEEIVSKIVSDSQQPRIKGEALPSSNESIQRGLDETKKVLELAKSELEESKQLHRKAEEQKNTMANLASLGILAASFGHETVNWTGTIVKNTKWLLENLAKKTFMVLPDEEAEIIATLNDTAKEAHKVRKFAKFTLGNIHREKRISGNFCLKATIADVFTAFDELLKTQRNIQLDLSRMPSNACDITGFKMDWESIIVNLITNAAWALEEKPSAERQIRVTLSDSGSSEWVLTFDDSGIGLEAGTEEMIFLPTFSTKRDKDGGPDGTGMGLFIVRSFIEEHSHGTIKAHARGVLGGASFIMRIPKATLAGA